MSTRAAKWLAWSVWVLSVAFGISSLVLQTLNGPVPFLGNVFGLVVHLAFATVGALVASRHPDNRIGWILSAGACVWAAGSTALEYGVYALFTAPGSFPGGDWMAWYGFLVQGLGFSLMITFLPLLFPDGRLLSNRWRSVAWLAVGGLVFFTIISVFGPSSTEYRLASVHNPLGIQFPADAFDLLSTLYLVTFGATTVACAASVFFRFRRARGDERAQLKWFAYAAGLGVFVFGAIAVTNVVLPPSFATEFGRVLFVLAVAGFPIAVGIAILRYRLYDIDLVIRRTLVYGILSAALAFVYFASVFVLQSLFTAVGGRQSAVAIVGSTLAIAALFSPLRRRLQEFIDRRFYRRKYDAARTLAEFAATARDETDLDRLTGRLVAVVEETMQPAHTALWLKPAVGRRPPAGVVSDQ